MIITSFFTNNKYIYISVYKNEKKYAQLVIMISYITVCMMHSHWLLSHSVLNKMMNTTERAVVMLLFIRRSSRISAKNKHAMFFAASF